MVYLTIWSEFIGPQLIIDSRQGTAGRAQVLFDLHKEIDGLREEELAGGKIGTTRRGIGPAYASKAQRNGVRVGELRDMSKFADKLRRLVPHLCTVSLRISMGAGVCCMTLPC